MSEALGCPCCGEDGAIADADGLFYNDQELICGCNGHVCVEEDGEVWISLGDLPCENCPSD